MFFDRFLNFLFLISILPLCQHEMVSANSEMVMSIESKNITLEDKTLTNEKIYSDFENKTKTLVEQIVKYLRPLTLISDGKVSVSPGCKKGLLRWIKGIRDLQEWAITMIDASGKPSPGILVGGAWFHGDYQQCIDVAVPKDELLDSDGSEPLTGSYCVLHVGLTPYLRYPVDDSDILDIQRKSKNILGKLFYMKYLEMKDPLSLRVDICIPSSCTRKDAVNITKSVLWKSYDYVSCQHCEKKKSIQLSSLQIFCCAVFAIIFGWVAVGTVLDFMMRFRKRDELLTTNIKTPNKYFELVRCSGSLFINTAKLLEPDENRAFDFTYGVRFFTIIWIIISHVCTIPTTVIPSAMANMIEVEGWKKHFIFSFALSGFQAVDTFFLLSACFQIFLHLKDSTRKIVYWKSMISKYLRLTFPQLLILATTFLLPLMGNGPYWIDFVEYEAKDCETEWWRSLTYTKNYKNSCQTHLWFLSCLMQLFLYSMLILFLYKRWPLISIIMSALLIPIGISNSFLYYSKENVYHPSDPKRTYRYLSRGFHVYYYSALGHASQYGVGLLAGLFLAKNPQPYLTKKRLTIGWMIFIISLTISTVGSVFIPESQYLKLIYNSVYATIWTMAVAILILMCTTGNGGIITDILSWKPFIPLGRLTFFAYLIHINVLFYVFGIQPKPFYVSDLSLLDVSLFIAVVSFVLAYIGYICIQLPFTFIVIWLFPRNKEDRRKIEHDVKKI